MKRAMADGWVQRLPTEGLRPLKTKTVKRQLITIEEFETICKKAFGKKKDDDGNVVPLTKNAQQLVDFLRFMAYSGHDEMRRWQCDGMMLIWTTSSSGLARPVT